MANYDRNEYGTRKIATLNLLDAGAAETYEEIVNNPKNWVRPEDIKIYNQEKFGQIIAVITYYQLSNEESIPTITPSPREIIHNLKEKDDKKRKREKDDKKLKKEKDEKKEKWA